ncbi:AraC family transcriptional regulator [Variovorax boronicumulans]|uniref:helix-turn-helix transcriptional regulator n=1 Tax=Variovorax boronicumulans TaxID=436515 RepID=UPI002784BC60|nr:AraC family transcriptional regulator [Variovorax boronicumulans]MDP9993956.1 AraC family transcriptional regulator [Variovorax boronicumulans]MDQ0005181.1 AraC family transcriptional regulator [Variovorax boronicumulans]MDQ0039000.1 AraC family transcriptional regulator [Variovorax boronicumulans]
MSAANDPTHRSNAPWLSGGKDFGFVSSSRFLDQTPWRVPYDFGTVYYCAAERVEERMMLDQHILGVEMTSGIVRTRLDSGGWSSDAALAGALYFVAADSDLHIKKEQPIDFVLATIDPGKLDQFSDELGITEQVPRLAYNMVNASIQSLATKLRRSFLSQTDDVGTIASEFVLEASTFLLQGAGKSHRRLRYQLAPHQLRSALEFINANLSSSLKVDALANELIGCSGFYFAHAFTEMLGCSPHQYILDRRLSSAHELIRNSTSSLAEISYCVGFSSQAHMTTTFCKRFGVTPGRLRQSRTTARIP